MGCGPSHKAANLNARSDVGTSAPESRVVDGDGTAALAAAPVTTATTTAQASDASNTATTTTHKALAADGDALTSVVDGDGAAAVATAPAITATTTAQASDVSSTAAMKETSLGGISSVAPPLVDTDNNRGWCPVCQQADQRLQVCGGCRVAPACSQSCADRAWLSLGHAAACAAVTSGAHNTRATAENAVDVAAERHGSRIGVSAAMLQWLLQTFYVDGMTTHDLVQQVVKPMCAARRCTFAGLCVGTEGHVGLANVFVSHAFKYDARWALETMISAATTHEAEREGEVLFCWFDPFSFNQHTGKTDTEFFESTFRASIRAIGRVMCVLGPWNDPVPLTRAWCLFEMMCAMQLEKEGIVLDICLPPSERAQFLRAMTQDWKVVMLAMSTIDAERADCFATKDRDRIFAAVRASVTFKGLNSMVKERLRQWVLMTGVRAVREMERACGENGQGGVNRQALQSVVALHFGLSCICYEMGVIDGGIAHGLRCVTLVEQVFDSKSPLLAEAYCNLGLLFQAKGELDKAEHFSLKCLAIEQEVLDANSPELSITYNNIGLVYKAKGELDKAVQYTLKALAIDEVVLDAKSPKLGTSYTNLALLYKVSGELDKAEEYSLKALAIQEEVLSRKSPLLATLYNNIGMLYHAKGEPDKSEHYALQALAIQEEVLDAKSPDLATSYFNVGALFHSTGKLEKAEEYALKALAIQEEVLDANSPNLALAFFNVAAMYKSRGDLAKTKEYLTKSLAIEETFSDGADAERTRGLLAAM